MRGAASPGLDAVLLSSDSKPISSDNDTDCVTGAIEDAAAGVCGEKQNRKSPAGSHAAYR